jgi:hypothetical protein
MRVWCGGLPLGDIDDHYCALYPSHIAFHWRGEHLDELWEPDLDGLDDLATWNFLDGALYGYHGDVEIADDRLLDDMKRDSQRLGKFNFLTNWGEQFDGGYKSFLMCPPGGPCRVLCRAFSGSVGLGVNVSRAGFERASRAFGEWFELQERRLGTNG